MRASPPPSKSRVPSWLGFVVVILASYRLTRVVTTDSISERARDRLYRWAWVEDNEPEAYAAARVRWQDDPPFDAEGRPMPRVGGFRTYVNELFNCPWCLGWWVSYAVLAFWAWVVRDGMNVAAYLVAGAAVAGAQGFLASRGSA
jgi:Protein of unknown function (DUF1360)